MAQLNERDKPHLLIVDDDEVYCGILSRSLYKRGYDAVSAFNLATAAEKARSHQPQFAIVDLRINQESGLDAVKLLLEIDSNMHIVVLTGYASISTAVQAIKLGAIQYLTKPAEVDEILRALNSHEGEELDTAEISTQPMSAKRMEWEHLQKVLSDHDGNISAAARAMGMHRRTLQRKLSKKPVKQ